MVLLVSEAVAFAAFRAFGDKLSVQFLSGSVAACIVKSVYILYVLSSLRTFPFGHSALSCSRCKGGTGLLSCISLFVSCLVFPHSLQSRVLSAILATESWLCRRVEETK